MRDYRSDKMSSLEGAGTARARFHAHLERLPDGYLELVDEGLDVYEQLPDEGRTGEVANVIELSELVSFWMAWHLAGGFAGLERSGWNRSTIFRKLRRFRAAVGEHPDDYRFEWLDVDWERAWADLFGGLIDIVQRNRFPGAVGDVSAIDQAHGAAQD